MGCSASSYRGSWRNLRVKPTPMLKTVIVPFSTKTKNILKDSWELVEPVKDKAGKAMFVRLFECHPNLQDTFPTFKGVSFEDLMNSRSLYLHAQRVMAAVQHTIYALEGAEVLVESLQNLGHRHLTWSVKEDHFKVVKEALLWTLQDMLQAECTTEVAEAWEELFDFITVTMLRGLGGENTDCC